MAYIGDATPARHERFSGMQILERGNPLGPYPELQGETVAPLEVGAKGRIYARGAKYYSAFSACGMCAYVMGASDRLPLVDFITAATGWDYSAKEMLAAGHHIQNRRQAFNYREGVRPDDMCLPPRLLKPPAFQGPLRGDDRVYDYQALRAAYFKAMGWDPRSGAPANSAAIPETGQ